MPSLKQLIEELEDINVKPEDVRIPGTLYDQLVEDAEEYESNPRDN